MKNSLQTKLHPVKYQYCCTVILRPRVSIIHVAPMVRGMATTMKTTENQLTSSRLTPRYWEVWFATGAKVSHIC